MDDRLPKTKKSIGPDDFVKLPKVPVSRRDLLKIGMLGTAATTLAGIDALTWVPSRVAHAASATTAFPDIQFNIGNFIAPVQTFNNVQFQFGPVYTVFLTAQLTDVPFRSDQTDLANALTTIEQTYPFSPSGIFTFIAYGIPYFNRLPSSLVN